MQNNQEMDRTVAETQVELNIWSSVLKASLTLSNRYSENSNLNLKLCVVLCNAIWMFYTKMNKIFFPFFNYYNMFFNSNTMLLQILM